MSSDPRAPKHFALAPGARASATGLAVIALAATGVAFHPDEFRWTRPLTAPGGGGPIAFDADAPLFARAGSELANLRVADSRNAQVPWRTLPPRPAPAPQSFRLLDRGRSGGAAVALVDLGAKRSVHDRIDLDLPGQGFVGTATVSGSDDRKTFTQLGSTRIFDLAGAQGRARSTAVTFSPSDFRYLRLRATGVRSIDGATVSGRSLAAAPKPVRAKVRGDVLDLGGANVPVDLLRVTATTPRYDRRVRIEARNGGEPWQTIAEGRVYRLYGKPSPPLELATRARYLRVRILNGDDPALAGVRIVPLARPRTILVEGGHDEPLHLLYGGRPRGAPDYELARLPRGTLDLGHLRRGRLGPPELNAAFRPTPDTRTWVKRHPAVIEVALALAAAVVGLAGFLALRRRT
jgi:hypothetical protein